MSLAERPNLIREGVDPDIFAVGAGERENRGHLATPSVDIAFQVPKVLYTLLKVAIVL